MTLPDSLKNSLVKEWEAVDPKALFRAQQFLMERYREQKGSFPIFQIPERAAAYLITRSIPIFTVLCSIFSEIRERFSLSPQKIVDLGAGPGTASWAALEIFPEIEKVFLYEKSKEAISLGKRIFPSRKMQWKESCLEKEETIQRADIALISYSLGELKDPLSFVQKIWKQEIGHYLFIEPGTPRGFTSICEVRKALLLEGATILAPCTHQKACPIGEGDWCHFAQRVPRSKIHKRLKKGTLGYEDEKYSYLFLSKANKKAPFLSRVLRHPKKEAKRVQLTLCTFAGNLAKEEIFKGAPNYSMARKLRWGDLWREN